MISVVLDTNVLVAALINRSGSNRAALRKAFDPKVPFSICYSSQMADEYADVLHRSIIVYRGLAREAESLLDLVLDAGEQIVPKFIPAIVYPDDKDRPFLEAAVYVDAVLLTNNLKDYPFLGVHVVAPEEFLDWCAHEGL